MEQVFSAGSALAMAGWVALGTAVFVPRARPLVHRVTGRVVPLLLAIAYGLLIWQGFGEAPGGGFGTIAAVRALFVSDAALVAGWFHYLAFDLFVGTWIARTAAEERIHPLLIMPCLALTLMLGPLGLVLFVLVRAVAGRGAGREQGSASDDAVAVAAR